MISRKMRSPKSIILLTAMALLAALMGCSSSSSTPPPPITVTLSTVGSSLTVNSQTPITATVANDPLAGSVNWSCAPSGSCGTFSATTTASGVATTYTAPAVVTSGVVITATVTDASVSASTGSITIAAASLADGTYVFSLSGYDYADGSPYRAAGVFTVAVGIITAGEQDFIDYYGAVGDDISAGASGCSATSTPIVSCLTTTADGNLQIILVTGDSYVGVTVGSVNGVETLNGTVYPANSAKAAITEYDGSASGSGLLETQTGGFNSGTAPGPASYAFSVGGLDELESGYPFAMGGIVNVDGAAGTGTISGTGSVFDANDAGLTYQNNDFSNTSVVSAADPLGRVTFTLDNPNSNLPELILAGYFVSANKIQLVETIDAFEGELGGTAFTQTVPSGGFTAANSAATYVIGMQGADSSPGYFLQSASQLTLASGGTVSGFLDYNDLTTNVQVASPDPVAAPLFTVATSGQVSISGLTDGDAVSYNVQLYLDGNGHALAITLDAKDAMGGLGYVQTGTPGEYAASDFFGAYTMGTTGWDFNEDGEFDSVGPVTADGSGSFTGFNDVNWLNFYTAAPLTVSNNTVSGAFTANADGIFSGTISGLDLTNCVAFTSTGAGCTQDSFNYYLIDATGDNIAIETDLNQLTIGVISQQ